MSEWLEPPDVIDGVPMPRDLVATDMATTISDVIGSLIAQDQPGLKMSREQYREVYLKSPEWRAFRSLAIEMAGRRCADCGFKSDAKQLDAHHLTYERLGGELLSDVVVVCRKCHQQRHGESSAVSA